MTTAERLRHDIDSGRTRDKVSGPDPAAAPLGTDAEAAGTPTPFEEIARDRSMTADAPPRNNEDGGKGLYIAALAVIALIFVAALWMQR